MITIEDLLFVIGFLSFLLLIAWFIQYLDRRSLSAEIIMHLSTMDTSMLDNLSMNREFLPQWNCRPIVVNDNCNGCRYCFQDCPTNAIEINPIQPAESRRFFIFFKEDQCIHCGICVNSCPLDVIGYESL